MTSIRYTMLKGHFDKIWTEAKLGNGLEDLRDTYMKAFDKFLGNYDICTTTLKSANNPIQNLCTIIGPKEEVPFPEGIIPSYKTLTYSHFFDKDYFMGLNEDNMQDYFNMVSAAIYYIIYHDATRPFDVKERMDPYKQVLRMLPIYLAYHHMLYVNPDLPKETLTNIVKYEIAFYFTGLDEDECNKVAHNIIDNKYVSTFERMYKLFTCENEISLV